MIVGYSRVVAISFVLLGVFVVALNVWVRSEAIDLIRFVPGVACLAVGLAYLRRPYFVVEGDTVVMPAPIGPLHKRYPFDASRPIVVRDGAVYIGSRRLGMRRWLAQRAQWDAFVRDVEARQAAEALD